MGHRSDTITLYTPQGPAVIQALARDGVCFCLPEYIRAKYAESAPLFLTVYHWFARQAARLVPPPPGAQLPYWTTADPRAVDLSGGGQVLRLAVPRDQAVFFSLYDWNKLLQLRLLTDNPAEEAAFQRELELRGLDRRQVVLTDFYPEWKQLILHSWERLFCVHASVRDGVLAQTEGIQAALWCLRREWLAPQMNHPPSAHRFGGI